jgi:AcrR family transcriptional regulator
MIQVTERLVAEQGLATLSLRTVQVAAGQRNKSAAQYHFGSRDGLIEAVLRDRMGAVNVRRAELLGRLVDGSDDPRELMDVIVRPLAEATIAARPSHWARFVVQCGADPMLRTVVRTSVEGAALRSARSRLVASIDHLPELLRERRVDHAIALALTSLAAAEARGGPPALRFETELHDLIDMCTAVVCAPCSPSTRTTLATDTEVARCTA